MQQQQLAVSLGLCADYEQHWRIRKVPRLFVVDTENIFSLTNDYLPSKRPCPSLLLCSLL